MHETKKEVLQDCTGDFELNGLLIIGRTEHRTSIRFKNMDDFGSFINSIDVEYDSEDVNFTGCIYELNTPQFKVVQTSAYGQGTNYMQKNVE